MSSHSINGLFVSLCLNLLYCILHERHCIEQSLFSHTFERVCCWFVTLSPSRTNASNISSNMLNANVGWNVGWIVECVWPLHPTFRPTFYFWACAERPGKLIYLSFGRHCLTIATFCFLNQQFLLTVCFVVTFNHLRLVAAQAK